MIDFHTHILPGIDDGAKSLEESLSLLKMEQEQGVDTIVLTPHYFHERQSLDEFLQQRNTAYEQLRHAAEREKISINFHLGASSHRTSLQPFSRAFLVARMPPA